MRHTTDNIYRYLLSTFSDIEMVGDAMRVQTHCLYADGQNVSVLVIKKSDKEWRVTDAGEGWSILRDHFLNPSPRSAAGRANKISQQTGVIYREGEWETLSFSIDQLIGSILLTANATQAWVNKMLISAPQGRSELIKEKLGKLLKMTFGEKSVEISPKLPGLNKSYEVSSLVLLPEGGKAAFEVVTPHSSSIYPAYTKFSDISHSDRKPAYMAMVLEGMNSNWKSDDLSLLRSAGADLIDIDLGLPNNLLSLR